MIKRDGERQRFDRTKLRAALLGAAHKRPVIASDVEAIVDRVELAASEDHELSSERIGELCLEELRRLDRGRLPTVRRNAAVDLDRAGPLRGHPDRERFRPRRARGSGVHPKSRC